MTAPPVSTSKLQMCRFADVIISAFVSLHLRNCTLLHVYFPSERPVDQLERQLAQRAYSNWYCERELVYESGESDRH